ncbi:MAG: rhodanese-like domain-containing protein [Verrucomicrobiota bacterium]
MNKEISALKASKLKESGSDVAFLDVREDTELEFCRINGAIHIPMGQIPERMDALPRDEKLIVFCHHGMRSLNVVQYLEAQGFDNAINMTGGIDAWATDVDSSIGRY